MIKNFKFAMMLIAALAAFAETEAFSQCGIRSDASQFIRTKQNETGFGRFRNRQRFRDRSVNVAKKSFFCSANGCSFNESGKCVLAENTSMPCEAAVIEDFEESSMNRETVTEPDPCSPAEMTEEIEFIPEPCSPAVACDPCLLNNRDLQNAGFVNVRKKIIERRAVSEKSGVGRRLGCFGK
ncbi:MAG: hypothetical protein Q4C95_11890 [Planctomycetia bacterium]|nr:hypothetical protein [Planctomycetia bacterium]